ncbi:uncharacterized protein PgNI_07398 [Pyricularia grisea]|uniref:Uncharacterized protein n=1 Tax=Pyricularia grisea TaxID=148305 RepID=A0A6P8B1S6_PYRGI|nr:uncharacterized protein PgNI_07398 [Pyricularia grisea]TLD08668.1 hypothetical protein PgNI_07398 [Pyricularia grisea]
MGIKGLRAPIDLFLQAYMRKSVFQSILALNLGGGQSVFIGFQPRAGVPLIILAQGGQDELHDLRNGVPHAAGGRTSAAGAKGGGKTPLGLEWSK